jgi:hypothetical protein
MEELEQIKLKLIGALILNHQLSLEGKFRQANQQIDLYRQIKDKVKADGTYKIIFPEILNDENIVVKHCIALEMLRLNFMPDKALIALEIVEKSKQPVNSLVAGWQIKWWKENGSVDPPNNPRGKKTLNNTITKTNQAIPTFEPALAKYEELNSKQRFAFLAGRYDGEVNNGGHLQYFENKGTEHLAETIKGLKEIGAKKQAKILTKASNHYFSKERQKAKNIKDFLVEANKGEYSEWDEEFYKTDPEISDLIEKYLQKYQL